MGSGEETGYLLQHKYLARPDSNHGLQTCRTAAPGNPRARVAGLTTGCPALLPDVAFSSLVRKAGYLQPLSRAVAPCPPMTQKGAAMAVTSAFVQSSYEQSIATVTLNDPAHKNALSMALIEALSDALLEAEQDPSVRCVILAAAGDRAFCAGADLKEALNRKDPEAHLAYARALQELFLRLWGLRCPTIAAVNGAALAGGLGLVLCCDMAVAGKTAVFGTPEVRVGLWPMMVTALLREQITPKRAMELCLLGEPVSAAKALDWGLVNAVVPQEDLMGSVMQLAQKLAPLSPDTLAAGKRAWQMDSLAPVPEALPLLAARLAKLSLTPAAQEGMAAFREKRPPIF